MSCTEKKFKKSLVFEDIESKILFRWYDPRVMTYLDDIFNEHQMNSLLGSFIQWQFIHPSGYFQWKHIGQNKLQSKAITQINGQQSLALDLIEIANIVFKKSHEIEQVDVSKLKPKQILKNIYQGHEQFKITKYTDLLSYGLYAEVLGKNFMMHPYIIEILKLNWGVQPDDHDFMNAMNYISTDDWVLIRQDLENYNLGI
ncbi:hypothetical protein [Acinetobacter wuhouensis]|uniref:DUF4123 domain-containing protein n=1 Tax=Acinetobacter wuhouensis TaxID=1879050 RepID=A0A3G2T6B4_9GAMM|nr:hypothetical protein [Acinetobacter wuhouensis]AYO55621.1 hypothetical protein CDG68_19090 [Acinetobacter wuhouensis]